MNCRNSSTPTHRTWGWLKTGLLGAAFALFGTTQAQVDVTATAGTLSQSYTQLNLAFAAINAGTHQGVITIGISGNTTESASAVLNSGAVAPAAWTSMSITPTGAPYIIEGTIAGAVIKLNGADNVTIDGRIAGTGRNLTIRNNSTAATTAAVWLASVAVGNGCSGNTIRNCEIACNAPQNTGTLQTYGILMCGTTISLTSNGVENDNNTFQENRIIKCRHGIATRGTAASDRNLNIQVLDNIVGPTAFGADQIGKVGIYMQADENSTVRGNTVQFVGGDFANTTGGADRYGIAIGVESWSMTPGTITSLNYTVSRNLVHDIIDERTFSAVGIGLQTTNGGSPTNNVVCSNIIYNVKSNGTAGDQAVGLAIAGGHSDQVVYNSIRMSGDVDPNAGATATSNFGSGIRIGLDNGTTHANLNLKNNVVYMDLFSSSTAAARYYAISGRTAAYTFGTGGQDHNDYYINPLNTACVTGGLGTASGTVLTNQFPTLANWQTAYTAPQDANSIQADPGFISDTDLHISAGATAVNNVGTVAGVTCSIDFDNEARSGTPDIGADEYTPLVCAGADGGTITPATASACSGGTYVMTSTGSLVAAGISNQWQVSSTPGGPYAPVSGGSGATSTSYTTGPLTAGTYYYVMTNTCSFGGVDDSNELTLTVNPTPTASAGSNSPLCEGQPLNLTGTTDIGTTFSWTGPLGYASGSQSPQVSASATGGMAGTYTFTATDNGCTSAPSNTVVVVNLAPIIVSTTATPNPICFNGNSQLNVNALVDAPFVRISEMIINRGGTGTGTIPLTIPGADLVELNNTSGVQADISGWTLAAYGNNTAIASHSIVFPSGTIIPPNSWLVVTLGVGTNDPVNRVYYTGGANDSYFSSSAIGLVLLNGSTVIDAMGAANTPTVYTFAGGTGVTGGDWSGTFFSVSGRSGFIRSASVDSNTAADWVATNTPSPLNTVGVFNAGYTNTNQGTPSSYLWSPNTFLDFDNIANPMANNVTVPSEAFTVTVSAPNGCTAQGNVTLNTSAPITAATITGTLAFCTGGNTTLTAVPTDGAGPYTYLWSPNGETTASINVTVGGNYSAQVDDACGGSVNTGPVTVVENPTPTASASSNSPVCAGSQLDLFGTTDIGTTFSWTGPNSFADANEDPSIPGVTAAATGTYSFTATLGSCTSAPATTDVVIGVQLPVISSTTATPGTICPGGSSQLQVNIAGGAVYCATIGFATSIEPISNVTFAGINNSSTCTVNAPPANTLEDFTGVIGNVVAGGVYPFTASGNTDGSFTTYFTAFFDWDQNGTFESQQAIGSITNTACILTATNNVTVPAGAFNGNTRMRVVKNYFTSPTDACGAYSYGQAEDYTINVTGGVDPYTYSWSNPGTLDNAAIANPTATINTPGTVTNYTVTVTQNGCSAQGNTSVTTVTVDDGDPCTLDACSNGVVTNTFQDADGDLICDANDDCPNLAGEQGDPCDDGLATTGNDVINGSCVCEGQLIDCLGVPGGAALPGTACNDGDPNTGNDVYQPNCTCAGVLIDCLGVPGGTTLPGTACDDGDANTISDVYDANCVCAGTPIGGCSENNVVLTLNSDANANQTTWNIINVGNQAIVCSGDAPTNNSVIIASCCLPDGCYSLEVYDSMGDGINPGGFVLRDANDSRIIDNVNNGNTFTSLSKAAPSFCVPLGTDALTAGSCDQMSLPPNGTLTCVVNPAVSAQYNVTNSTSGYQWHIFNPHGGYTRMIFLAHNTGGGPNGPTKNATLKLADIVTLPVPQNVLLNVRVRSRVAGTYAQWGPVCRMRVGQPPCATTKLVDDINNPNYSCGVTRTFGGSQYISAISVLGVNRYQFRFERVGGGYIRTIASPNTNLTLAWNTLPLVAGNTYNVTVRVSYDGGSTYCPYGASCTVAIVAPPVAQGRALEAEEELQQVSMQLFPNPNRDGLVTVRMDVLKADIELVSLDVTDLFGKRVHAEQLPVSGTLNSTLDLSGLASGVYVVTLTAGSEQWNQRLVIQR
ncbi:MAG: lamin tail domain-containing protein [Flavobacteriales bacterium]|nr:lamin tail domain-containing protein [Flavobacteriales bacterium]